MSGRIILVESAVPGRCAECRGPATLRCVCCGGKFCDLCEPDEGHAVELEEYLEERGG